MAIYRSFDDTSLSAFIDSVRISTEQDFVEIRLLDVTRGANHLVYRSAMVPYNGSVVINQLGVLIEEYMESMGYIDRTFAVTDGEDSDAFRVIYCKAKIWDLIPDGIFFTALPYQSVGSDDVLYLTALNSTDELSIRGQYWRDKYEMYECDVSIDVPFLNRNTWSSSVADIDRLLRSSADIPDEVPISAIVARCGVRHKTWMVSEQRHNLKLSFLNMFNAPDTLSLSAKISAKLDSDRDSALVGSKRVQYIARSEKAYEVETGILSDLEAEAVMWALMSNNLTISTPDVSGSAVVSDITADISSDDSEERTVKFAFRLCDTKPNVASCTSSAIRGRGLDIFTQPYTPEFL